MEGLRDMALVNETSVLLSNAQVGPRLWLASFESPDIAGRIAPGQFVHMRIPNMEGHILRRPFSVYDRSTAKGTIEVLYQVVGFGTDHMTKLGPGDSFELIGPVGHGWDARRNVGRALLVAGGVGAAPLYLLAEQLLACGAHVEVVLGAQTEAALVARERYEQLLGRSPQCATDDGSFGHHGFCTELAESLLSTEAWDCVYACGPEPVMRITASLAQKAGAACQVSMERRMACGIGACLSCVVDTVEGKRRACVDGPVFDAEKVVW